MWLTDEQVQALTRRKQPAAQERVLKRAKIQYRMVDGRPVVPVTEIQQTPETYEPKLRLVK